MVVLKYVCKDGKAFHSNDVAGIGDVVEKQQDEIDTIRVMHMTEEEYKEIPATSDSNKFFCQGVA